jgi:endonuclease YncB( thermonuclease family)
MDGLEDELHGTTQTLGGQSLAAALVQDGNAVTGGGQLRYFFWSLS